MSNFSFSTKNQLDAEESNAKRGRCRENTALLQIQTLILQLHYYSNLKKKRSCELFSLSQLSMSSPSCLPSDRGAKRVLCSVWSGAGRRIFHAERKQRGRRWQTKGEKKERKKKTGSAHGKNGSTLRGKCRVESLRH